MKKILLSMTFALLVMGAAFAAPVVKEPSVMVKTAFAKEFSDAKDIKWEGLTQNGVYEVRFTFNNESLQAYFTEEGEFLGTMRLISASRLPVLAANALARQYAGYHIVSTYEYSMPEGVAYYITVSNEKGGMMLKATGSGELTVYKKIKS